MKDYNQDKKEEVMEKAEDVRGSVLQDQNKPSSRAVVNKAYKEFKDGDITYDRYTAILDSVRNTSENMSEEKIKENTTDSFIEYLEDHGMLEDYLEEHETVAEELKIENLDSETKGYLDRIEEAYKNGELNNADYEELRSVAINEGTEATVNLLAEKLSDEEDDTDASNVLSETFTRILNGGAAVTSQILREIVQKKGLDKIASVINQYIAENTPHFRNL